MSWRTRRRGSSKQKGLKFKARQKAAERRGGRFQPPKPTEEEGERQWEDATSELRIAVSKYSSSRETYCTLPLNLSHIS